jgi:uncharacterized protein
MAIRVNFNREKLKQLAQRRHIVKLMLFGSVLRDDFGPKSDVDVLVKFAADSNVDLFDMVDIKEELEIIFGRMVDLVEEGSIRNPYRQKSIDENKETVYAA